jgi:hypothetical protein
MSFRKSRPFRACGAATLSLICLILLTAQPALARNLTFETGIERLHSANTTIEGLHRFYIGYQATPHLSFGQSIYSAGIGNAGGAFFWGFEGGARLPLSQGLSLSASGFVGGGGGALQVIGDGTMLRAGLALDYQLADAWAVQMSGSWIRIAGAPINGPAFGLGLRRQIDAGTPGAWATKLDAAGVFATAQTSPSDVRDRNDRPQPDVAMVGARALFDLGAQTQLSLSAAGAGSGAEGYMQVMGGLRRSFALGNAALFIDGHAGFGGGGHIDTGAGPRFEAAAGLRLPVTRAVDAELSLSGAVAPTGSFRSAAVSVGVMRNFKRTRQARAEAGQEQTARWAYSGGLTIQRTGPGYFVNNNTARHVVMQESAIDYFIGENLYVSGVGQTTLHGGAAGYAVGLLGMGYQFDMSPRWTVGLEGRFGAAGGGGVNAAGGVVGSVRGVLDYRLTENFALSLGLGQLRTLRSSGMSTNFATLGVKIPFTTR